MRALTAAALAGVVTVGVAAGCADADIFDPITHQISCQDVCERYEDCVGARYDVPHCTERCEDRAPRDDAWTEHLSACDECMDERSCGESTFGCKDECAGLVP
jgi:hypothetical protein